MKKLFIFWTFFLAFTNVKALDNCFLDEAFCFKKQGDYFFSDNTSLTYKIENGIYIFYLNNNLFTGSKTYQNKEYYFLNGRYICYKENDTYYNGKNLYTGVIDNKLINNGKLELNEGIIKTNIGIFYLKNQQVTQNTWYLNHYFGSDGKALTGLNKINNKYYIFTADGLLENPGWVTLNDEVYYVKNDKSLTIGLVNIDNYFYYFNNTGKLTKGLIKYQNKYFYIDGLGKKDDGLVKDNKNYYYLKKNKLVKNKWVKDQGYTYYLGNDGKAYQGLKRIGNDYYYFSDNATLQTGFQIINDKIYYFNKKGKMVLKNGKINNQDLKFSNQGYIINSWVKVKGYYYLTKSDGSLVKYWYNFNNKKYFFDGSGRLISKNAKKIIDVSKYQGNIDWNLVKLENEIDGIIVRLGFGTSYVDEDCVVDEYFLKNIQSLNNFNIPYAVYLYSYAVDRDSAKKEAEFVINTLKEKDSTNKENLNIRMLLSIMILKVINTLSI